MKFKFSKTDLYLILAYYLLVIPISLMEYSTDDNKMVILYDTISMVVFDLACLFGVIYIIFPRFFLKKQYVLALLSSLLYLIFLGALFINIYCYVNDYKGNPMSINATIQGLIYIAESFATLGIMILGKKLFEAQLNFVNLEKEKKESELKRLTSQVDPHFLFNNLNTVDSLIDTNPKAAKVYLNKLAQLYRYLISSKDQDVVELEEELEFVKNYIYLIESRFGKAFQFQIINQQTPNTLTFIPPGALQTLLENIVKHNQPTSTKSIKGVIFIKKETIEISNNLNIKKDNVDSTGTGLTNLKARYELLTDKEILIETSDFFKVTLPLIQVVE